MNDFPVNKGTFNCIVPCSLLGWAAQGAEQGPMNSAEERSPAGQGALCRNNEPLPMQGQRRRHGVVTGPREAISCREGEAACAQLLATHGCLLPALSQSVLHVGKPPAPRPHNPNFLRASNCASHPNLPTPGLPNIFPCDMFLV